jgi:WD40 repeat protein
MKEKTFAFCGDNDPKLCLTSHGGGLQREIALPFSPRCLTASATLVASGGDGHVCIIDVDAGDTHATLRVPSFPWSLAFDEKGMQLACGLRDGHIVIFSDLDGSWTQTQQWKASNRAIVSLIWTAEDTICSADWSGRVALWNAAAGECVRVIQEQGYPIHSFVADKSKRFLYWGDENGIVRKFDLESSSLQQFRAHQIAVRGIFLADNDITVLTCSYDHSVAAFDAVSFVEIWRYGCSRSADSLAVIEHEVFVGVFNASVVVLDVSTGELIRTFDQVCSGFASVAVTAQAPAFTRFKFHD